MAHPQPWDGMEGLPPENTDAQVLAHLRDYGREQMGRPVPVGWRHRRLRTPHRCYEVAGRWAIHELATYTEGRALSSTGQFWIAHAWLTAADGGVVDLAWPEPGLRYVGVTIDPTTVAIATAATGQWGPVLPSLVDVRAS